MGDPAGVGPEIILKALMHKDAAEAGRYLVYGSPEVMKEAAQLIQWPGEILTVWEAPECRFADHTLEVISCGNTSVQSYPKGKISGDCGDLAFRSVRRAIEDALNGSIDAAATAPISKEALRAAGHQFAGHTEIYAHFTHTADYTMLLMEGNLRVAHISTHVSLKQAIELVQKERIVTVIQLVHDALIRMGISQPRIAVAGLNPHAGENGLFGREELDEIIPAVTETQHLGASGPYPPDTIFSRAAAGQFDAVIAMFHDQGHIPLKMAGFHYADSDESGENDASDEQKNTGKVKMSGINITLGIPIIRCSVDHGTAFDIAWKGKADESSMVSAVVTAAAMAETRELETGD